MLGANFSEFNKKWKKMINRPLKDFDVPYVDILHSSIINPAIQTNNFELKSFRMQIMQKN